MKTSNLLLTFALPAFIAFTGAHAADVPGVVCSADATTASVMLTSNLAPAPGDKATIYFIIPGGEDEVVVATGSVASVAADAIQLKVDNAAGTVAKDQKVRITSDSPRKRAPLPANPKDDDGLPPVTPGNPPGIKKIENDDGSIILTIPGKNPGDPPRTITIPAPGEGDPPVIEISIPDDDDTTSLKPLPGDQDHPPVAQPHPPGDEALPTGNTLDADNPAAPYFNKGYALLTAGRGGEAIAAFTKVIELEPGYATAYNNRANDCLRKPDYAGALADCIQSIELDPTSPLPYYNRGFVYSAIGKKQQAVADWSKAVAMEPAYRAELEPLIQRHGGTLPRPDIHERDTGEERIRRIIPPDADSSRTTRPM